MKKIIVMSLATMVLLSCADRSGIEVESWKSYRNPVVSSATEDPSVTRGADGRWYLAQTNADCVPITVSDNLTEWGDVVANVFSEEKPSFVSGGSLFAPDLNYTDGHYILYYSLKQSAMDLVSGIGVAVADAVDGEFTDKGALFVGNDMGITGCTEPSLFCEGGSKYLVWGANGGIFLTKLSDDGLSVPDLANRVKLANEAFEAATIVRGPNYYYLIASKGSSEGGADSTHELVVGRSVSLEGPYLNNNSESMLDGASEPFIGKSTRYAGVGHCSSILKDDKGDSWILYNAYPLASVSSGRCLLLDKVEWKADWPFVMGGVPSFCQDVPYFNNK